jgi:hypothetical protein
MTTLVIQEEKNRKYNLSLENVTIRSSIENGDQISVRGTGDIEITTSKNDEGNYTIPNFNDVVTGEYKIPEDQTVKLKEIPLEEAKQLIKEYIDNNPGTRTSDIICNLGIDIDVGLKALKTLKEEGFIHSKDINVRA